MSNRNSGPSKKSLFIITLLSVTVVGSLAAYVKMAPANTVPANEHRVDPNYVRKSPNVTINSHKVGELGGQVMLLTPHYKGEELSFTSSPLSVPPDQDPKVFAINEFLRTTKLSSSDARVLSVDVKDGIATLSFNPAFESGYGTDDERTMIEGLQRTMGQFTDVQKIEIVVDGKNIESLGNIEISEPLDVLREDSSSASSSSTARSPQPQPR